MVASSRQDFAPSLRRQGRPSFLSRPASDWRLLIARALFFISPFGAKYVMPRKGGGARRRSTERAGRLAKGGGKELFSHQAPLRAASTGAGRAGRKRVILCAAGSGCGRTCVQPAFVMASTGTHPSPAAAAALGSAPPPPPAAGILIGDRLYSEVSLTIDHSLIPEERLSPTPSMQDGLDLQAETDLRILGCELIQSAGIILRLPQVSASAGGREAGRESERAGSEGPAWCGKFFLPWPGPAAGPRP